MAVKELVGVIVSANMQNSRIVAVNQRISHKTYQKVVNRTKRYVVHDASFNTKNGDKVKIRETRPLSKTKRWILINVLENSST